MVLVRPTYLGAYWRNRAESAAQCGARLRSLFAGLARIDPAFLAWTYLDDPVDVDAEALARTFTNRKALADARYGSSPGVGYSLYGLHPGAPTYRDAVFSVACGGTGSATGKELPNSVVVELPTGTMPPHDWPLPLIEAILAEIVHSFDPDWAMLTNATIRDSATPANLPQPHIGPLTYFRNTPPARAALPDGVVRRDLPPGVLLSIPSALTGDAVSVAHLALYQRVLDWARAIGIGWIDYDTNQE